MTAALKVPRILTRRRRTRAGWIDITEQVLEDTEPDLDSPDVFGDWDPSWPPTSPSPRYTTGWAHVTFSDEPTNRHHLIVSDPHPSVDWWDNGWPRSAPDRVPVVWSQMELGTRATDALWGAPSYRAPDCQWCEPGVMCPRRCPSIRCDQPQEAAA